MSSSQSNNLDTLRAAIAGEDVVALSKLVPVIKESIDTRDVNGRTLFQQAVFSGHTDSALWLIDNGIADINAADNQGETALMRAAWLGNQSLTQALIERGADISARSRTGGSPLHFAYAGSSKPEAIVSLLAGAGADASAQDNDGRPPSAWSSQAQIREAGSEALEKQRKSRSVLRLKG